MTTLVKTLFRKKDEQQPRPSARHRMPVDPFTFKIITVHRGDRYVITDIQPNDAEGMSAFEGRLNLVLSARVK